MKIFKKDFLVFCILIVVALGTGLLLNRARHVSLDAGTYHTKKERIAQDVATLQKTSSRVFAPKFIMKEVFADFVEKKKGIVVDARYRIDYQYAHVPEAINLPADEFAQAYAKVRDEMEPRRNEQIVVYCEGDDCKDSELVQQALNALGYKKVAIYKGGWKEWNSKK